MAVIVFYLARQCAKITISYREIVKPYNFRDFCLKADENHYLSIKGRVNRMDI